MEINGKPRVIVWFVSNDGRYIDNAVNILERQFNGIETVGVTATQKISIVDGAGKVLPFLPLNEISLNGGGYDILLVAGARGLGMSEVVKFAKSIHLDTEKLLGDWIVCIPGFTLDKYRQIQHANISIFTMNCFGGLISNTFGLPFLSPFVNLFFSEQDFIRFMRSPRVYMEEKLVFEKTAFENNLKFDYPIFRLGNIRVNMNHYPDFDKAVELWNNRKQRINWYNIFVEMTASSQEILEQFEELPHGKKVCFVPFKSNLSSAWYINPELNKNAAQFSHQTHLFARGDYPAYYDMFDMLLYGKKTPLVKM